MKKIYINKYIQIFLSVTKCDDGFGVIVTHPYSIIFKLASFSV